MCSSEAYDISTLLSSRWYESTCPKEAFVLLFFWRLVGIREYQTIIVAGVLMYKIRFGFRLIVWKALIFPSNGTFCVV
jgi:hypothetical protein